MTHHAPLRDVLEATAAALATATNRLPKRTNPHVLEHLQRTHAEARAALAKPLTPQTRILWATPTIPAAEIHPATGGKIVVRGSCWQEANSIARTVFAALPSPGEATPDPMAALRLCLDALDDVTDATGAEWRSDALCSPTRFYAARQAAEAVVMAAEMIAQPATAG